MGFAGEIKEGTTKRGGDWDNLGTGCAKLGKARRRVGGDEPLLWRGGTGSGFGKRASEG